LPVASGKPEPLEQAERERMSAARQPDNRKKRLIQ
jgi:hypothetical protein